MYSCLSLNKIRQNGINQKMKKVFILLMPLAVMMKSNIGLGDAFQTFGVEISDLELKKNLNFFRIHYDLPL